MQFSLFLSGALLSALSLTSAQSLTITGSVTPAQASNIVADVINYIASVEAQPQYTCVQSVLATAVPASASFNLVSFLPYFQTASPFPPWFAGLPTDVQSYINSIAAAETSIANKDLKAAAPQATVGLKLVGGVLAAGAMGMVFL
ncbi:hypothetical protein MMC18_008660 [Xylographa bjoerkii]|nr:hypothetical protein [Xylographa bjoerkii]